MCTVNSRACRAMKRASEPMDRLFEWLQKVSITYKPKILMISPFTESICWAWRDGSVRVGGPCREPEFSYQGHVCGSQLPAAPAPEGHSLLASMGSQSFLNY